MEEELKATFRVCHATKSNGVRCGSPAMTGANFCYNRMGLKTSDRATSTYCPKLGLVYPSSREAIQHNLFLIAQAMNDGKIDSSAFNSYIRLYRVAEQNLTRWEKAKKDKPMTERDSSGEPITQKPEATPGKNSNPQSDDRLQRRSSRGAKAAEADRGPVNPLYADIWDLPSPEFAYRLYERVSQKNEAGKAAKQAAETEPAAASEIEVEGAVGGPHKRSLCGEQAHP